MQIGSSGVSAFSTLRSARKLHISQQLHLVKQAPRLFPRLALQLHSFFTSLVYQNHGQHQNDESSRHHRQPGFVAAGTAFSSPFFGGSSMNRLRSAFLGLGLLLVVSGVQAQETRVKANIPFDFVVGNQVLPAGEYMVASEGSTNQAIVIRSNDSKTAILSLTNSCSSSKPSDTSKLVFHRLAGRYFLSQVWAEGNSGGRQLPQSRIEVQLAKNNNARDEVALAASLTR